MTDGDRRPSSDDSSTESPEPASADSDEPVTTDSQETSRTDSPRDDSERPNDESIVARFLHAESGSLAFARETLTSVGVVVLVGLLLFAISGVWPPMVAVESGSMTPHLVKGDLVFITTPGRFVPTSATHGDSGVVTYRSGKQIGYKTFHSYGNVVIYANPHRYGPPVIHRARFWVNKGENWYPKANPSYIYAQNCQQLENCPAPHAGFITKGDANPRYDQANGISSPVRPQWIKGIAMVRIPYLGWIRLVFSSAATGNPATPVGSVVATNGTPVNDSSVNSASANNVSASVATGYEFPGSQQPIVSTGTPATLAV